MEGHQSIFLDMNILRGYQSHDINCMGRKVMVSTDQLELHFALKYTNIVIIYHTNY